MSLEKRFVGGFGRSGLILPRRYGTGAINDAHYDSLYTPGPGAPNGQVARFAGLPEYKLFFSTANTTTQRVANWRAAFPRSKLLAYHILYNLTIPAVAQINTPIHDLVNETDGLLIGQDLWLRYLSNSAIATFEYPGEFGYYFWTQAALDILTGSWLPQFNNRFDGVFLDNLSWSKTTANFSPLVSAAYSQTGQGLKINGFNSGFPNNEISSAQLTSLYNVMSPLITKSIRDSWSAVPEKLITFNGISFTNSPTNTLYTTRPDPYVNGGMAEQDMNTVANIVFNGKNLGWRKPYCPMQQVGYDEPPDDPWPAMQAKDWPSDVIFMPVGYRPGRLP